MREIFKAFIKTGSGSAISLILNIISIKVIAVLLGPVGVGLFSLLRQIRLTAFTAATLSGQTALVQGASLRSGEERIEYSRSVLIVYLIGSSIATLILIVFAPLISSYVINQNDISSITLVRLMWIPVILSVLVGYLSSILNVHNALGRLAIVQASIAVAFALLSYPIAVIVNNGIYYAFIVWMGISQAVGVFFSAYFLWKDQLLFHYMRISAKLSRNSLRHFFSIAGTMSFTGLIGTSSLLLLRSIIIRSEGLSAAGIFDAAWTISLTYVMLILTSFQTYYLPTLTPVQNETQKTILIRNILRFALLIIVPVIVILVILKPMVITLLYSSEFLPAISVIRWMLIGDYFKVFGWILGMTMIAFADMKYFFLTEVLWYLGFLGLSSMSIVVFDQVQGIGISFMLLYFFSFIFMYFYTKTKHNFHFGWELGIRWWIGLLIVVIVSWQTWHHTEIDVGSGIVWLLIILLFSWTTLTKNEKDRIRSWGRDKISIVF